MSKKVDTIEQIDPEAREAIIAAENAYNDKLAKLSGKRFCQLPELACRCGDTHFEDHKCSVPMGTMSLEKVI